MGGGEARGLASARNLLPALALALAFLLLAAGEGRAHHPKGEVLDPELFSGWEIWLHLSIQWAHLVAYSLWTGLTLGALLLGLRPRLDGLLLGAWSILLVSLATDLHNTEYSSGISVSSNVLEWSKWRRTPYGIPYSLLLNAKVGLYVLAVLFVFSLHGLRLGTQDPGRERRLSLAFLLGGSALAFLLSLLASVVLFYHEAADLWPTPLHSMGGVLAPGGAPVAPAPQPLSPPPNDFRLLADAPARADIAVRWSHLLGFGLWLGGTAAALAFGGVSPARFLALAWGSIALLVVSGLLNVARWTPFWVPPYPWNLEALSHVRFGRTYTLLLAAKLGLVLVALALTGWATARWMKSRRMNPRPAPAPRGLLWASLLIGLAIAYLMMMVLLVHEGVDHAL